MAKHGHRSAVSCFCRVQNVGSACNAGGSSSLHRRMNATARMMQTLAAMRRNRPQTQPPFPAAVLHVYTRVKHTVQASTGITSAAHSSARAPLQPHLYFLHATPRHTLHYPRSPAPRRPGPVEITYTPAGAVASRRHAVATQPHMTVRRALAHTAKTPSACDRRSRLRGAAAVLPDAASCLAIAARRTTPPPA